MKSRRFTYNISKDGVNQQIEFKYLREYTKYYGSFTIHC